MSLLGTGVTALNTAQLGLATTMHNISNVNTPGYSRQSTMQATNIAMMTGAGSIGMGVHVQTILRNYDDILNKQVNDAQTKSSELGAYFSMISRIDNLLADPNSGISPMLAGFFQATQDVAANPTLISARQAMTSSAQALVTRFQTLENRLAQLYDETNTQISTTVNEINAYSGQIADLNEKIIALSAAHGHPPNDLLDAREQLVFELNQLVRVSSYVDSDNSLNVFIGNGQPLVVNIMTMPLVARPSDTDPERIVVGQKGTVSEFPESYLDGGALGGLLTFRKEALDQAANALGQVAASVALTVNAQQALGQDLLGTVHGEPGFVDDFFRLGAPKSIPNALNVGTGSINGFTFDPPKMSESGNFFTDLKNSDYEVRFTSAGGGAFTVTRLSDKAVVASGNATATNNVVSFDGLTLDLSNNHAVGDTYLLEPTREAARNIKVNQEVVADVRRIAAAMPIRTKAEPTNTGHAVISAGEVGPGYTIPSPALTFNFNEATNELQGFTAGAIVNVNGIDVVVSGTGAIPYTRGEATAIIINGFSFNLTGFPNDGDAFTLEANEGGTADSRNIVKIGALQTALTTNGDGTKGVATFQVAYAQLVSDIGTKTKTVLSNGTAQDTVLQQALESKSTIAGVNLDEEAANLLKYQQAYQAAARVMNTVSTLFDTLLSIGA
ncbi:flagellar hook-associated protein FlgK [Betaproteobacteria bacterium]|nr:flagellar hook-associated protein FlgK [Betaproteobacteria bacterium]GHU45720.1 flagellar hook-associated protein FlgK [Betaproteobacteria bacterium]